MLKVQPSSLFTIMIPLVVGVATLFGCAERAVLEKVVSESESAAPSSEVSFVETSLGQNGRYETVVGGLGQADKLYQIGSISKYACTLAILDMQTNGMLKLTDSLSELLPAYLAKEAGRITPLDLLQNRSGLADGIVEAIEEDPGVLEQSMSGIDAANRFAVVSTTVPPGEKFEYVLSNWIVVQALLEHLDGRSIQEVLAARVFGPAGLSQTTTFVGTPPAAKTVQPSESFPGVPSFAGCAGGVASTSEELLRLMRFPYRGAGFDEETLGALSQVTVESGHYALGGRIRTVAIDNRNHALSWQSGSNGPFKSRAAYDPILDVGIAIVTNESARDFIDERRELWLQRLTGSESDS